MGGRSLLQSLGRFALFGVGIMVVGLVAGIIYGKSQPRAAAGALIADFVLVEDSTGNDPIAADPDLVAPSSGDHLGTPICGGSVVRISNDDHLASIAMGVVVIRYRDDLAPLQVDELRAFAAARDRVVTALEPRLDAQVMAVGWAHRLPLDALNVELLSAFHTARVGFGPNALDEDNPCSP